MAKNVAQRKRCRPLPTNLLIHPLNITSGVLYNGHFSWRDNMPAAKRVNLGLFYEGRAASIFRYRPRNKRQQLQTIKNTGKIVTLS